MRAAAVTARPTPAGTPEPRVLAALPCNLALAILYVLLAVSHIDVGRQTGQWATIAPLVLQETVLVVLFLIRRPSLATSSRPLDWVAAITASFLPLAMRPTDPPSLLAVPGGTLQVLGIAGAIAATLSLGTSIGIVPGNRGVRTRALYRWVRHPMYAAYLVGYVGYVTTHPSATNLVIAAVVTGALVVRIRAEERFLSADPAYRAYVVRTRWRLVPGVY